MGDLLSTKAEPDPLAFTASPSATTLARWQRIKEIFGLVLDSEAGQRMSLLRELCAGDESMMAEVSSLLASAGSGAAATSEVFKAVSSPAESVVNEREDSMLGRRVGDYRIDRRIGYGGMAAVYLASRADEQFRMLAAIKLLRPDPDREDLLQRFLNERQTLAALAHPNIVKLLDGGSTEEGLPYLVMDYVDGIAIDKYCDAHNLSIRARLELFVKVCGAVEYAHAHSVIHRDLKPNNILVTNDGIPKLLDFGIAKVLDPDNSSITRTANRHLTPAYASPEQVRGEAVTVATDIYSLGVVLYHLLSGHRPYRLEQHTPAAMERAICEQEPESPSTVIDRVDTETLPDGTTVTITAENVCRTRELPPDKLRRSLRGDLDNIVLKALQKEPQRRYSSVAALAADIRCHLSHQPVQARPQTLAYRTLTFVRRHKPEVIAGAAVALVIAAANGVVTLEKRRAAELLRAELASQEAHLRRSVGILGFHNVSGRAEKEWISTALAEMLSTELSAGGRLRAIPGEDIAQMKLDLHIPNVDSLNSRTLRRIHDNLGTDLVVLGSYVELEEQPESRIRVDIRLQDATQGETLASVAETGSENDLAGLVNRAGMALREKLGMEEASPADSVAVKSLLPSNVEATRFYSDGLIRLRQFDILEARDLLGKATAADPAFALAHSALGEAYAKLGYESDFRKEAKEAFDLANRLPREQALLVQARYFSYTKQGDKAVDAYHTLFSFFPENLDYGLALAAAQLAAGKPEDSTQTIQMLRKLPAPEDVDPRIDMAEANVAEGKDYKLEAAAAHRAAARADALGRRLLAGRARILEGKALNLLGESDKALPVILHGKDLLSAVGDHYGEALALKACAAVYFAQDRFKEDRQALEEALHLLQSMGNRRSQVPVLINLGNALMRLNEVSEAKQIYLQSLAISREIGDKSSEALNLANLAILETSDGDLRSSAEHFQEAVVIDRENGAQAELASVLENFALTLDAMGKTGDAEKALQEAIQISRKSGQKQALSEALISLGDIRFERDGPEKARGLYMEAIDIAKKAKNDLDMSHGLSALSGVSEQEGDIAQAHSYAQQSLSLRQKAGDGEYIAMSWLSLAGLSSEEGSYSVAEKLALQAAAGFHEQKDWEYEARAKATLAEALTAQTKLAQAQAAISDIRVWAAKTQDRGTLAIIHIAAARYQAASGNFSEARQLLLPTIQQAKKSGFGSSELEPRLALGEIDLKSGNVVEGCKELTALEHDARAKGFMLIARKAASVRRASSTQP